MTPPVTQKDIAERIGVSVSLVSRALAGQAESIGVAKSTVTKVRRAARELGYLPNASARILKGASARTVGVVVYDFADPFFGPVIHELQRCAHKSGYSLVLGGFENRQVWELDVTALLKHHIDGLIIIGSGPQLDWVAPFVAKGLRVVRIGHGPSRRGLHTIESNDQQGLTALVSGLAEKGRQRLAFAGANHSAHRARFRCFKRAVQTVLGQGSSVANYFSQTGLWEAGYDAGTHFAAAPKSRRPDAIIAASDVIALGILRALAEHQLEVPADCAVTGYDDIPAAALAVPALTTVHQPIIAMARAAFDQAIEPHTPNVSKTVLAPTPIWRESA